MTTDLDFENGAELLRALGHGVRLSILTSLIQAERSVGDIEARTGVGQPMLSQQLGILRKAGLVSTRREAKMVFYSIDRERIAQVARLVGSFAGMTASPPQDVTSRSAPARTAASFARVGPAT